MLTKEQQRDIKEGIKSGLYRLIRLVKKEPEEETIIGFNRQRKDDTENLLIRFEHIKKLLFTKLAPGVYAVEVKSDLIHGKIESFPVTVTEKKMVPVSDPVEPGHSHFEILEDEDFMDKEEYRSLIRELESLRGQVTTLTLERNWYLERLAAKEKTEGLADKSSWQQSLAEVAKTAIPSLVNLTEKFLETRQTLMADKAEKNKGKIKIKKSEEIEIDPEKAINYYHDLMTTDPDRGDAELDNLEEANPELYAIVYDALWPEGEEEAEEEEEEEEEEEDPAAGEGE